MSNLTKEEFWELGKTLQSLTEEDLELAWQDYQRMKAEEDSKAGEASRQNNGEG